MPQIFPSRANVISRLSLPVFLVLVAVVLALVFWLLRSPLATGEGRATEQPVLFSHAIHAGNLGLDCRYCHTSVESASFAGMPPTQTCMNCHSQILTASPLLDAVHESWEQGTPLRWRRVHDLADFVYFDHSIHLDRGVGCVSCHGRVDEMTTVRQVEPLTMGWCLDCHREPERHLRPPERVFDVEWQPENQRAVGRAVMEQLGVTVRTSCSTCHR